MGNSPSPKPPKSGPVVVPFPKGTIPKRERRDPTEGYETPRGGIPRDRSPSPEDDTERNTIPDESPTDKIEVTIDEPVMPTRSIPPGVAWDLFDVYPVPAGKTLVSILEPITTAYAILQGEASEYAPDRSGTLRLVRKLGPGSLVNAALFHRDNGDAESVVEVRADTQLFVYYIAEYELTSPGVPERKRHKRTQFIQAALAREASPKLNGRAELFELYVHAYQRALELQQAMDSDVAKRVRELNEKVNGPLKRENVRLAAENVTLTERIAELEEAANEHEIDVAELKQRIAELGAELARSLKDRENDMASLELILDEFDELVDEGILDASEKRIAELVSIFEGFLLEVSTCGDMALMQKAMHVQSALFSFKMKAPKDPIKKP